MTLIDKAEPLLPCPFCGAKQDDHGDLNDDAFFCESSSGTLAIGCSRCMCIGAEGRTRAEAIAAWNRRAALPARGVGVQERVQHKKRGSTYRVVGRGKVQTDTPLTDYAEVVVYQCEADGTVWVRPVSEFEDGRFAALEPAPTDAAQAREAALIDGMRQIANQLACMDARSRGFAERILALIGEARG